jgi:DNA-binding NarL/FixJ family response regulator
MNTIKVMIADDHAIIRDGFQTILGLQEEIDVVGTAQNGVDAVQKTRQLTNIDVILMDLHMPEMNGLEALRQIKEYKPDVRILMLTSHAEDEDVLEAIAHGADGFLLKDWPTEKIISTIRECLQGMMSLPSSISARMAYLHQTSSMNADTVSNRLTNYVWEGPFSVLSEREQQILILMSDGLKNDEIGRELFLSVGTVKNYISSLYKKLDVSSRKEALTLLQQQQKSILS